MKIFTALMASIKKLIKSFTQQGKRELKINSINEALAKELSAKNSQKLNLRRRILKDYNSRKPSISKFIPSKGKNTEKVRVEVERKYGDQMNKVGLKLNQNLQLK